MQLMLPSIFPKISLMHIFKKQIFSSHLSGKQIKFFQMTNGYCIYRLGEISLQLYLI